MLVDLGPKVLLLKMLGLDLGLDRGAKVLVLKVVEGQSICSKGVTGGRG